MEYSIKDNINVSHKYHKITLKIAPEDRVPIPGQFYNVRCSEGTNPLLRRPLSVHRIITDKDSIHLEMLYQIVGTGPQWLSRRQKGEILDIIGPFGNGFMIDASASDIVIVAGGCGIAPLYAVCESVSKKNRNANIAIIIGVRSKTDVFYEEPCREIGELHIATDDGSYGFHGTAFDLYVHLTEQNTVSKHSPIYGCGPPVMFRGLAKMTEKFGTFCQVSLETHMGCAFGACLTCALPLRPEAVRKNRQWPKPALQWSEDGNMVYSLVCKDGPVYDIKEVLWDEWID